MERRDFLTAGAIAGAGAMSLGSAGCAALGQDLAPPAAPLSGHDMDGFLARLDGAMGSISVGNPFSGLLPRAAIAPADEAAYEKGQDVLRKTMRSLLLTGSFRDLPEEGRAHPGMQERMWRSMGEMDEAMLGVTDALAGLTPTERADIGRALREDPGLGMRLVEALDREGAEKGVPLSRRLHMRAIAVEVSARLKQSAPMLIDEYVGKVRRVAARHGSNEEIERRLAAQMGDTAFWAMRERTMAATARWNVADVRGVVVYGPPYGMPVYGPPRKPANAGMTAITVGAVLLGIGVITASAGGIVLAGGALGGAFAITAGAVLGLAGLITLIVGLCQRYG
jgi:hypothetical protein